MSGLGLCLELSQLHVLKDEDVLLDTQELPAGSRNLTCLCLLSAPKKKDKLSQNCLCLLLPLPPQEETQALAGHFYNVGSL